MGLTIHYNLNGTANNRRQAQRLVEQMRQLALDLPFEQVKEVQYLGPDICKQPCSNFRDNGELYHALLHATCHVPVPWSRKQSSYTSIQPLEAYCFWTEPGPGSEWASFGLARFPREITFTYDPRQDDRFIRVIKEDYGTRWEFDREKWRRQMIRAGRPRWTSPESCQEQRIIKTGIEGWHYRAFCKTQYASAPDCGGVPNFIRCHLCVVHLLDKIKKLPGVKVSINDEGKYGRSHYTDEPGARKPRYTWHKGKYNVKELIQEVGQWNEMIAATFGGLKDLLAGSPLALESPIGQFSNFEQLEFKGSKQKQLIPFLNAMKYLAENKPSEETP
jgi:hypothetical protein